MNYRSHTSIQFTTRVLFFTLFLDLIGFSIIFPLFPNMLTYYLAMEGHTGLLGSIVQAISNLAIWLGGATPKTTAILFGGFLVSIFSLLQFLFTPLFGVLSDRFGRKPLLIISVVGVIASYAIWVFSGRFIILVVSRLIGGMMSSNLSIVSAAVADITTADTRSRGMALIGIAFGLGFILGPAFGGILSIINLTNYFPSLITYGLNPFSMPALFACVLGIINLFLVATCFHETLSRDTLQPTPSHRHPRRSIYRSANPFKLFRKIEYAGVSRTHLTYFIFIIVFTGMEFTLTFLAAERLGFTPIALSTIFVFYGTISALVQGGYVRRKACTIGEKQMAIQGLFCAIPGLALIGYTQTTWHLFLGIFCMAISTAQTIPCLTSLTSLYTPPEDQGRILGIFRSLGALSRIIGPVVGCVIYWKLGSAFVYYIGSIVVIVPLILASKLPTPIK